MIIKYKHIEYQKIFRSTMEQIHILYQALGFAIKMYKIHDTSDFIVQTCF